MTYTDTQVERAIDALPREPIPEATEPNAPEVTFPSSLVLTGDREQELVHHACERIRQLEEELGRHVTSGDGWYLNAENCQAGGRTFLGKREYYDLQYHNHVEWRPYAMPDSIFAQSNLTVPISRRLVRQMIARAVGYFFRTDPWFNAGAVGTNDTEVANKVQKHAQWKLKRMRTKRAFIKAIELAFVRGEAVLKTTNVNREHIFRTKMVAAVDESGNPIYGADGEPVTEADRWVQATAPHPETGEPMPINGEVLERDGVTPKPEVLNFVETVVTRRRRIVNGPEAGVVYYKDFLCPLTAEDVQSADLVAHLFDSPVMGIIDQYHRSETANAEGANLEEVRRLAESLNDMAGESPEPKTARNQPRPEWGENQTTGSPQNPTVEVAECYLRYDADGDGIEEEIMLVLDRKNQRALFYDYLDNVTHDGLRPFTVVRVNPIDGRWHGQGGMEMFDPSQQIIDLLINRRNFAESGAGRVTFWDPSKTLEGADNPNLQLNNGKVYRKQPNVVDTKEILDFVVLPEVKGRALFEMMEFFMQLVQLESGVINAMDQQFAGLPSSKLATGINNIERSGQEMFNLFLETLEDNLSEALERIVGLLYNEMDEEEIFEVLEGDAMEILSLSPEEVRNLAVNVSLKFTQTSSGEDIEKNTQAANLAAQYYQLPFPVQEATVDLYRQAIKAMGIENVERIITPINVELWQAQMAMQFGSQSTGSGSPPGGSREKPTQVQPTTKGQLPVAA